MNPELLAGFVASCTDAERRELTAALRVGIHELQVSRSRNGSAYDPTAPAALLGALTAGAASGQRWPLSGQDDDQYVTVSTGTQRTQVPGRTLRRWAQTGRVRGKQAAGAWLVHLGDVERERTCR